jgi:low affinity Fe/Cu permease
VLQKHGWWIAMAVETFATLIAGFKSEMGSILAWWQGLTAWRFVFGLAVLCLLGTVLAKIAQWFGQKFKALDEKLDAEIKARYAGEKAVGLELQNIGVRLGALEKKH